MSPVLIVAAWMACSSAPAPTSAEPAPANAEPVAASAAPAAADETRRVDILVDGHGYAPSSVQAQAGESLDLVFKRLDENNCGGTLVFPATGQKHDLPVGEEVSVKVVAPDSGKLAFTCGMGMYEGSLVVGEG